MSAPPKKRRRENGFDKDGKCFRCLSSCTHDKKKCDCSCSMHLLSTCPKTKKDGEGVAEVSNPREEKNAEATLGLYSRTLFGNLGLQPSSTFMMTEVQNNLEMDNTVDAVVAPEMLEEIPVDITRSVLVPLQTAWLSLTQLVHTQFPGLTGFESSLVPCQQLSRRV